MLMEIMDESLTLYVEEKIPKEALNRKGSILLDVAEGLKYLHSQKPDPIVHRDLSPNNILLMHDQEITIAKIADLGVAKAIHPNSKSMREIGKLTKVPGTKDFMPPEAFVNTPMYNTPLDVFSYGGVVLFVATHQWPSPDSERKQDPVTNTLIALNEVQRRQKYLDRMEDKMEELKPLVQDCLNFDPDKRPTMLQVAEKLKSLWKPQLVTFTHEDLDRFTVSFSDVSILGQELGRGSYGRVFTVKYRGDTYAAKEIHQLLEEDAQTGLEKRTVKSNFLRECYHCSKLSHPNIVRVIGVYYKPQQSSLPVMLMEIMDESLTLYVDRIPREALNRKGSILLDVAEGLKYLHAQKPDPIVHRDLSPNNILLMKNDQDFTIAKIADLGVAKAIHPNSKSIQEMGKLTKMPGTMGFMPPEAFEDAPVYGTPLDVFSYGGVVLFVATHQWPSPDSERKRDPVTNSLIALNEVQRRQKYLDKMEDKMEELKPLVEDCLNFDPDKRPTMLQVAEKLKSVWKPQGIAASNVCKLGRQNVNGQTSVSAPNTKIVVGDLTGAVSKRLVSIGSVQNERYSLDAQPVSDHDNEDEYVVHSNKHSLCMCVFDGHDGSLAVKFVKKLIDKQVCGKPLWDDVTKFEKPEKIEAALADYIEKTDKNFFKSIDPFIKERRKLQSKIPKGMKPSQAQQVYPVEVARIQKLDSHMSGGCTAVMAVLTTDRLYIANVGNSRALLAYKERDGSLQVKQLSVDHSINNEQELERLTSLGLDREQLKKSGRLGTQENTRSIGDYILKGGYKDMDILCHAANQPGSAVPHVTSVAVDHNTFEYIIVMSDGVYKTLEAIDGGDAKRSGNDIIVEMIEKYGTGRKWNDVAINILQEIRQTQYDLYQISASGDARSPMAIANRKRDDMTLLVYKFDTAV